MSIADSIDKLLTQQSDLLSKFTSSEWVNKLQNSILEIKNNINSALTPELFSKTLYVSTFSGNDLNTGTLEKPLKTIKSAIDLIPINGYGEIILLVKPIGTGIGRTAQSFPIDSDIEITNKTIVIRNEDLRTVHNTIQFNHNTSDLSSYKLVLKANVNLTFKELNITTSSLSLAEKSDRTKTVVDADAIIKADNSFGVVNFNNCAINIYDYNFLTSTYSELTVSLINSSIKQNFNKYLAYLEGGIFKFPLINTKVNDPDNITIDVSNLVHDVYSNQTMITYLVGAGV